MLSKPQGAVGLAGFGSIAVDGAPLAVFRILIGALVLVDLWFNGTRFAPDFIDASFHFKYPGFGWVPAWPGDGLYWHLGVLGVLSVGVMLGVWYRLCVALLAAGYAALFLMEAAYYSNNAYWLLLSLILLAFLPANAAISIDARRPGWTGTVPQWALTSAMLFTAVPLLYMGLVRLNADWLSGTPMDIWFRNASRNHWQNHPFGVFLRKPAVALYWSYFAVLVHLAIIPMLLWRPLRWIGLLLFCFYYAAISVAFQNFIFPLPAAAGFALFFGRRSPRQALAAPGDGPVAGLGQDEPAGPGPVAVAALLLFHIVFPARSVLYDGPSAWTGDGYRFSWRTMLDNKQCTAVYTVHGVAAGDDLAVTPRDVLVQTQRAEVVARPDLTVQLAHALADKSEEAGARQRPKVTVQTHCTLNKHPGGPVVDPDQDLTAIEPGIFSASRWVLPIPEAPVRDAKKAAPDS